jgi:magnesium transporter
MALNIDKSFLNNLEDLIAQRDDRTLLTLLSEEHPADIAEIFSELDLDDATYVLKLLDSDLTSDALLEIEDDKREKILKNLSAQEIA